MIETYKFIHPEFEWEVKATSTSSADLLFQDMWIRKVAAGELTNVQGSFADGKIEKE